MSARAGTAYVDIRGDFSALNRGLSTQLSSGKMSRLGRGAGASLTSAMSLGVKAGAVGVGAGLVYAVKKAADFEGQISSLGAVSDASGKQMERFRRQALKAGADTKFSALEAAQAQTELAKGGLSVSQILRGGLRSSLALAAAGQMDLAEAGEATVNAMKLFGLRGKDAMKVADGFATAANTTTADVSDFALALKQGGSAAKTAGLDFIETTAALEALADIGIKGSDAGTSLKAALAQMASPSKAAADAAKKLNVEFFDQQGNIKNLADLSGHLRDRLGGLTKQQRLDAAATLVGTDGMRALLALYDAGPRKMEKYERGLSKQGTAADVAKKKQDNLKGSLEQLGGSAETLGITVGSQMTPLIRLGADELTDLTNRIAEISKQDIPLGEKLEKAFDLTKAQIKTGPFFDRIEAEFGNIDFEKGFAAALDAAIPVVAKAGAGLGVAAVRGFFGALDDADPLTRGVMLLFAAHKLGVLSAVTAAGRNAGTAYTAAAASGLRASAPAVQAATAAMWQQQAGGGLLYAGQAAGKQVGAGIGQTAPATAAAGFGAGLRRRGDQFRAIGKTVIGASLMFGVADAVTAENLNFGERFKQGLSTASFGALPGGREDADKAEQALVRIQERMRELTNRGEDVGATMRQIVESTPGYQELGGEDFERLNDTIRASEKRLREVRRLAAQGVHLDVDSKTTERGLRAIANGFDNLKDRTDSTVGNIRSQVRLNMRAITRNMRDGSEESKAAVATNFRLAAAAIKRSMDAGEITTEAGMAAIERYMRRALAQYGIKGKQATRYLSGADTTGGGRIDQPLGGGASSAHIPPRGEQRGGHIIGGKPTGDSIPALLERDEYVLNRNAVRKIGKDRLDQINFGAAPRFQSGGMVHVPGDPPGPFGDTVNRSVAGLAAQIVRRFKANITAGFNPGGGHKSPGHNVTGTAVDIVPGPGGDWGLIGDAVAWAVRQGMTVYYDGSRGSINLPPHGPGHHAHLELGGASGAALQALVPKLERFKVNGPDSALKGVVQGAVDMARGAAQRKLESIAGLQRGGLVGLAAGGSPLDRQIGRTLKKVRASKTPKVRREAVSSLLAKLGELDLPRQLATDLKNVTADANKFGEYADRAGTLTIDPGDGGDPVLGVVNGKTQAEWLADQLASLFRWRNLIIEAEEEVRERREKTAELIEKARQRLTGVREDIGKGAERHRELERQLKTAEKHPQRNRALIKRLRGDLRELEGRQRSRERVRDAIKSIIGDSDSGLVGKRSKLNTLRGDLLQNLETVQGVGSPMERLTVLPALGVLGGSIFDTQVKLGELLNRPPRITDASSSSGSGDQRADLLDQLLAQERQRTAVSEAQFDVFKGLPPYGGSFATGGVVTGPVGAARTVIAHGGEVITPPGQGAANVRVLIQDERVRVFINDIEQAVERVTRRQARQAGRGLPGGARGI